MGFQGYGGSELDHSDCLISPCSECIRQRQRQTPQPSVRSGNAYTDPTSRQNDRGSRANVFGYENSDGSAANRATRADTAADNTENLPGGLRHLSISDEDRTLRDEMRQSGFRIPSTSEDPALRHPEGRQNRSGDPGFQYQDQPQADDGRVRLSDEDRALRDEMRRSGFRIPSVSDDPALSHPDGGQNRSRSTGFQAQGQYQEADNYPAADTGSHCHGPYQFPNYYCQTCQPNSGEPCGHETQHFEESDDDINIMAPWAYDHPTTEETLRRVLMNKRLASQARSQESAGNLQSSTQPATASQNETGRREVPMDRETRLDESEMKLDEDETYDRDFAFGCPIPGSRRGRSKK